MASYQKVTSVDLLIRWLSYTWNTTSRRTFCATDFIWCSCTFRKTIAAHVYFQYLTRMGHTHFSIVRPQNKAHYWGKFTYSFCYCPACRTTLVATRFRVAVICPIIQVPHCIRVFFYLFDLCLLITFFNFIMNYVPIVTFWIFTYHKIWILSIMFCFIWSYCIIYFLACLEVPWRVVS